MPTDKPSHLPGSEPHAAAPMAGAANSVRAAIMDEARRAGLLDGEEAQQVSFRAPPALVEAAMRETGVTSTSELGVLALALLATSDPVATFFRRTEGRLGPDHDLVC